MTQEPAIFRTLDLPTGALLPFASVPGTHVRVVSGRIWLTEEGSLRDVFLGSREEALLDMCGLAVIETLGAARIQLMVPGTLSETARVARRLTRWLTARWLREYSPARCRLLADAG